MDKQLQEFYYDEVERGHLNFEDFPEYNDSMKQSLVLFPSDDLPKQIGQLLDVSNCISFAHGLKLGLKLKAWAQ